MRRVASGLFVFSLVNLPDAIDGRVPLHIEFEIQD